MIRMIITVIMLGYLCGPVSTQKSKFTISGQIKDLSSGEDLISASVYHNSLGMGTTSNDYGFYSLTLEEGSHELIFSYLGFEDKVEVVELKSDVRLDIELAEQGAMLNEIVISAAQQEAKDHVNSTEMSIDKVSIETVKKLPSLFGEVDIIKAIQLLPGVKSVGEGSSGFYVRGGNVDQNLILLDEAPIYNASHVLGFFSSFNPEAIKDMKLYKGAIPAYYGGRLSSVLDIRMKEGNAKHFAASGGIGTLMSRLAVEAPVGKNGSFMLAGRRSYIDVLAKTYESIRGNSSDGENEFFFYDLNAKINYRLGEKDRVFASGYFGRDVLGFNDDDDNFRVEWGNKTGTIRWNHIFSPKLFANLTYYYSQYDYSLDFDDDVSRFLWVSNLKEHSVKADFGAYLNPQNTVKFGIHTIQHQIAPGNIKSFESDELIEEFVIQENKSWESALYVSHEIDASDKLRVDYGIRLSLLQNVGPQESLTLNENYEIVDTVSFSGGIYNTYFQPEPRLGVRYQLNGNHSLKLSYNRTAQYIQLASNGNTSTPFDIWFSSSAQVKPQLADQVAIGYFKMINGNQYEFSAELYYKKFINAIDFKDHAQLLLNDNIEAELRLGEARAYGLELMLRKNQGRFTGWISYTYSKAEKKIDTVNNNEWYNAKYDKPHDLSIVGSYELSKRITVGSNFVYSTGSAVTFPTGKYEFLGKTIPVYSDRNGARLPDFHRLDFSLTLKSKKNPSRRFQSEWVFGIYNAYNRKNAFAINFKQEGSNPTTNFAVKESIFAIVPSLTYNAKF